MSSPDPFRAKMFAEIAHAGQVYNSEVPYTFHLEQVVEILKQHGLTDPVMLCAGYLHDTIEDSNTSYNDIKKRFGEDVAELVYAVTSELGRNRKERNKKTYPKLKGNEKAICLKLADRIANVNYGLATEGKNEMYVNEYPEFCKALRVTKAKSAFHPQYDEALIANRMWNVLDKLLGSP